MRKLIAISAFVFMNVLCIVPARADLIVNGGFEAETPNNIGGQTPDGWSLTGNAANFWTGGEPSGEFGISAHSGDWYASFGNYKPGSDRSPSGVSGLQQIISDIPGAQYTLTFWYTAKGPGDTQLEAAWNGNALMNLTGSVGSLDGVWQFASFVVTGTGNDTLSFSGYMDDGATGVDDVSLAGQSVPEPSSVLMTGLGVVALLGLMSRRRRHA